MSSAAHTLDFLQTQTVSSMVQGEILRMIKTGELVAGAKLTEIALAERLGVSRAPPLDCTLVADWLMLLS